jgi:tRNA-modifying protein YgfZ
MLTFDLSTTFSRIRLRGSTRADFLHRMSTGDLLKMQPGEGRATALLTPIGRMIDYLLVLAQDDSLLLLGQGGAREKTLRWLRKHIFFNDDVQVSDETETTRMAAEFEFEGLSLGEHAAAASELSSPLAHRTVADSLVGRAPAQLGDGCFVITPNTATERIATEGDPYGWDAFRISHGYPAFPNEISEDYIPLEAGLWGAVSFSKGCYTGQEIIARMESRGQIAKKLCTLVGDKLESGAELFTEAGESAGKVTSATSGAALGYIRSAFAIENASLRTAQGDAVHVSKVVRL